MENLSGIELRPYDGLLTAVGSSEHLVSLLLQSYLDEPLRSMLDYSDRLDEAFHTLQHANANKTCRLRFRYILSSGHDQMDTTSSQQL